MSLRTSFLSLAVLVGGASAQGDDLRLFVAGQLPGIPGDNRYSNLQEARLAFWEQTVVPLVTCTVDTLNGWLLPQFDNNLELVADTDSISALAGRNQAIWERVEHASYLSDDEKRAAVGYPPRASSLS